MKTIYLNEDFKCSVTEKEDTVMTVETDFFNGKCNTYIEGYRYVPEGQTWTRKDGEVFTGIMVAPFKDSQLLEMIQALYEETSAEITDTQLAVAELYESGVTDNG